jgi:hypothetical protein
MIRSSQSLAAILAQGRTVARLMEMTGSEWRWVLEDTNEPVHGQAIKTLERKEQIRVVTRDLCGDPIQLGGVA